MKLYTVREVALILRINPQVLYRWIQRGKLKVITSFGRTKRISEDELKRFLGG